MRQSRAIYAHLLEIVATWMLGGCASDFTGIAIQHKVLGSWTDITGARTGVSPFGHSPDTGYITLLRFTAMSKPGSISVSRDNLVFVSDNFKQVIEVYRFLGGREHKQ